MSSNVLSSSNTNREVFKKLRDFIFDDFSIVDEEYLKHSETLVCIVSQIDLKDAETFTTNHPECGLQAEDLAANWMASTGRSYNEGVRTSDIDEMVKAHEVTETITVTKWKPLDEKPETCSINE